MKRIPRFAFLAIASIASTAFSQAETTPRIGYVYPAGGKQGTTLEIVVGGKNLDGVNNARVSGTGVQVSVVEHVKPLSQGQAANLREKLKELHEKKALSMKAESGPGPSTRPKWTLADDRAIAEIQRKLAQSSRRTPTTPAIAETVVVHVVIAENAAPGQRELRLGTSAGLSNPLVFWVNQLTEIVETESREGGQGVMNIAVPAIINGQVMPGDEDRYRFKAKMGERIVVSAAARELVPYLPDAVPGWFQGVLALYDSKGNELEYADHHRFHPDPVIMCKIPADGEYTVLIRDALYRGREDFVYRIAIGRVPFINSIFPLGGKVGTETTVMLNGWNLPVATLGPVPTEPGIIYLTVKREDFVSNRVPFAVDTLPEAMDEEKNNTRQNAQSIALGTVINGRIDYPGDEDVFKIQGKAGQVVVAETIARRLMSPLDSILKITDSAGNVLKIKEGDKDVPAINDDTEDKGAGLMTHHADSLLRVTLPADGTYFIILSDAQKKGGSDFTYRLRITAPRPDFELRVVPSSISVRGGSIVPLTVFALRRDGFEGDIALSLKNPPAGFSLSGARIPAGQDRVRLTLTALTTPNREHLNLYVEGKAQIDGQDVVHPAVAAEDMMQAFAYRHLVPAKEMKVVVAGRGNSRVAGKVISTAPVKIPSGGTASIKFEIAGEAHCELSEPPEGLTIKACKSANNVTEVELVTDATKIKPGLKGNLILTAFAGSAEPPPAADKTRPARQRTPIGLLPAVSFEVVAPTKPSDRVSAK